MAVGDTITVEFLTEADRTTGAQVTRLTDDQGDTMVPYFTQAVIERDRGLLLLSSNRSGQWQAYALTMATGQLVQLSDAPNGIDPHASTFIPRLGAVAYVAAGSVVRVDLDSFESWELYTVPAGFRAGVLAPHADGTALDFACYENWPTGTRGGLQVAAYAELRWRRPASLVVRVATDASDVAVLYGEREWIAHVLTSPADANLVVFSHEGPWDQVERLWGLRARTHEVWSLMDQRPAIARAGHEFFLTDGRLAVQWAWRSSPTREDWRYGTLVLSKELRGHTVHTFPSLYPQHVQSNSTGTVFAGDTCHTAQPLDDANAYICLIRHEGIHALPTPLCRHGTSWRDETSHPHPVFTPDDRYIVFNSDRGGRANAYLVPAGVV